MMTHRGDRRACAVSLELPKRGEALPPMGLRGQSVRNSFPGPPMRILLALLLMLSPCLALAEIDQERYPMTADVVVSGDGQITGFTLDPRYKGMEGVLRAIVTKWRFEPIATGGEPVEIHTTMVLRLHVDRGAEGEEPKAQVEYRGQGTGVVRVEPPRFPDNALRAGVSGIVLLEVSHDAQGRVTSVEVEQSKSSRDRYVGAFEKAAIAAAKGWRFQPERINGEPLPGRARVPVSFTPLSGDRVPKLAPSEAPLLTEDGLLVFESPALLSRLKPGA